VRTPPPPSLSLSLSILFAEFSRGENPREYKDESDIFFEDPVNGLLSHPKALAASHLVMFEALVPTLEPTLAKLGYQREISFFNSHFHDDSRRQGQVVVWRREHPALQQP